MGMKRFGAGQSSLSTNVAKGFQKFLQRSGVQVSRYQEFPADFTDEHIRVIRAVRPYTLTANEAIVSLVDAVEYIEANRIDGAIVECGVWKGGSMMAVCHTLNRLSSHSRELYLYDTYEGMAEPSEHDVRYDGTRALDKFSAKVETESEYDWCTAGVEEVRNALLSVGYPTEKLHFVKGKVEDTIPSVAPERIALLRLDTDWYESTKHELEQLYPRLAPGGILIIDDYGCWAGSKKATDEYFEQTGEPIFLSRVNYTTRMLVKPHR